MPKETRVQAPFSSKAFGEAGGVWPRQRGAEELRRERGRATFSVQEWGKAAPLGQEGRTHLPGKVLKTPLGAEQLPAHQAHPGVTSSPPRRVPAPPAG